MADEIIRVADVSMCFRLYKERVDSIKEKVMRSVQGKKNEYEDFYAVNNVSFSLEQGESMALIGLNGSGKSTLLKLIAGVMKPTSGKIEVRGSIAPLIELGAGFDAELTARENIFLNGAVLGYDHKKMSERYEYIVEFSELGDFMDVPIKNFSSGMYARLGFSIATAFVPDILIVDEILSVGDYRFQEKCRIRIDEMKKSGTTFLFVSHIPEQVLELCQKALWLDKGKMVMLGDTTEVCAKYQNV